jgi:hypothetical protein
MIKLLEINYPQYKLKHRNGYEFVVKAQRTHKRLVFNPIDGWNCLSLNCQQDPESLLEAIDDAIYNATPEVYDY